jgi:site-specific DNA recombinase
MPTAQIRLPWSTNTKTAPSSTEHCRPERLAQPDPNAVQAIARATALSDRKYASVEELAASAKPHAKVVRNELRLAFLSPDIVDAVLDGSGGFGLRHILESGARHRRGFRLHALS